MTGTAGRDDSPQLAGRTVLVTGGAHRIGRAICRGVAAAGANVVVHYRSSSDAAEALVADLRDAGVDAAAVGADLAEPSEAESLYERACSDAGRPVDAVVNNASVFEGRTLDETTYDDLDRMMRLHVWAPLAITRALAASGVDGAAVVNMLDTRIVSYDRAHYPYIVSKRALADLTRSLAKAFAPGVRVNGVAPGGVLPPRGKGEEYMDRVRRAAPLQRLATPEQVVDTVLYLLGTDSLTGQTIFVDGGRHLV